MSLGWGIVPPIGLFEKIRPRQTASFGYPTHVWNDYVSNDPKVAPLAYRPRMVAVGGGYPILEDGKLIGGIGISGGNYQQDQDACVEALTKIGFELPA